VSTISIRSVRGVAVASATAVTAVGAVVGMGGADPAPKNLRTVEAADSTLLSQVPAAAQAEQVGGNMERQAEAQQVSADATAKKKAEDARRKAAAEAKKKAEAKQKAEAAAKAKKKAEAEAKAKAKERERANRAAERKDNAGAPASAPSGPAGSPRAIAQSMMPANQFQCFSSIVTKESGWNPRASNPSSGAYGLVQALPGSKMASAGADWRTNPATQIKWGLNYMNSRYGSPCGAWSFWQQNHWY
jgi:murein DD-endopeptidase MepM/ murein hydrolase activator NlpD